MKEKKSIRIGCASGFWGDTSTAAKQLVEKGKIDYLVFDFLAEVTMSILARAKMKDSKMGYATDFINQISPLIKTIKDKNIKVLSNAGGINPVECKNVLEKIAKESKISLNIATVIGDDLTTKIPKLKSLGIVEMEDNSKLPESYLSVNAYLGAPAIVEALSRGADIVITGRCVDSALVLAPLMHDFKWTDSDYNLLASGSLAGHIIECGAQCTGGNFTDWETVKGFDDMGFPIVEVKENGDFLVTKPENTGGIVNFGTVAEQLLYEIGNPSEYFLPDVVCDFTQVTIKEVGQNKVLVTGASGTAPTSQYKVSLTYKKGYRMTGTLVIAGKNSKKKGRIIANAILKKVGKLLEESNLGNFSATSYDLIGTDSIYGPKNRNNESREIVLRLMATHLDKKALTILSREMAQAVTGMTPGVINYLGGRPSVSPSINLYSFLLPKKEVDVAIHMNNENIPVIIKNDNLYSSKNYNKRPSSSESKVNMDEVISVPLIKLAFARSGDKGDNANVGIISRRPEYLPYISDALSSSAVAKYFNHIIDGHVISWEVPGIHGLNFLLKNALGGGGMASLNVDPQGKSYAQQLLEYKIPIDKNVFNDIEHKLG